MLYIGASSGVLLAFTYTPVRIGHNHKTKVCRLLGGVFDMRISRRI